MASLSSPDIEGIYETQVSLEFRLLMELGCLLCVDKSEVKKIIRNGIKDVDFFSMNQLNFMSIDSSSYLANVIFL